MSPPKLQQKNIYPAKWSSICVTVKLPYLRLYEPYYVHNHLCCDFSHEIPQKCSRYPPQLEKIWFFGVTSWFSSKTTTKKYISCKVIAWSAPEADPGIQVRGEGALKKIAPSGGRRENIWGITCEKSRFYAKKSYYAKLTMIPSSCSINIRGCPSFSADNSCLTCCRRAGCDRGDRDHYTCKCSGCPWH
jgi:hypothetical protein